MHTHTHTHIHILLCITQSNHYMGTQYLTKKFLILKTWGFPIIYRRVTNIKPAYSFLCW